MTPITDDFARPSTGTRGISFGAGMNSEGAENVDRWTNGGHQRLSVQGKSGRVCIQAAATV